MRCAVQDQSRLARPRRRTARSDPSLRGSGHSRLARRCMRQGDRGVARRSRSVSGGPSRRELIRAIAALALLPAMPSRAMASMRAARSIAPPPQPMLFARRLTRELSGGYSIVAERSFKVRFVALGDGFRIEGEQVSSSVDAPPNLAAYAKIEQERTEA